MSDSVNLVNYHQINMLVFMIQILIHVLKKQWLKWIIWDVVVMGYLENYVWIKMLKVNFVIIQMDYVLKYL